MMFFKKSKKEKNIFIHSPLKGEVIPLGSVPDPVFSQKMMGEGLAFIPTNGEVFSPVNGKVTQVFPTKHAIGMVTEDGLEMLLHLGLETVELKGEGFNIKINAGDIVSVNDHIGTFDLSYIEEKGKEIISVLVFPNFEEKISEMIPLKSDEVESGTEIAQLIFK
ncbi:MULTISPECIES: PTS glucose transporter subunit IIA [Bacillales]|jgi:sugar PTS system EIIA component|uniref:PTS sugar transporter subunit IIA n=3 Tax=Bacilli TaxID=91061 RepID=UPI00077C8E33|nr:MULTISPECIES: PTS glucose transporter subunit IIA [Bacillales]MDR4160707.1 PTS glucose transporter subunit IIA [Bacillus paranthracis]PTY77213.1 PTS glucose transporter subunit IIA [Heyndrickxia sporothermodurans]QSF35971.1 PTS glucose transporter subunit IIA [Priestia megaterium]HWL26637.1 PTS glucose transporter subunit IIA [Ureibacillus sp.]MBY0031040.1 PTS glucose transporter subunit IIA [Priestia aryabhattai]